MSLVQLLSVASSPQNWPATAWVVILSTVGLGLYELLFSRTPFGPDAPPLVQNLPIIGAKDFFGPRRDFLTKFAAASKSGQFSFYYGKLRIIGLSGEQGRKTFFESTKLDLSAGYATLFVAQPEVQGTRDEAALAEFNSRSSKKFVTNLHRKRLDQNIGNLVGDTRALVERLKGREEHILDPFEDVYRLVYQLTMRLVGCREIAEDPEMLRRTLAQYEGIDSGSTGTRIAFSWLPTPGHLRRLYSGAQMYMILNNIVEKRKKEGRREEDALQGYLDEGDSILDIVAFTVGSLFAGLVNTGINAAYIIALLADNRDWHARVQQEVDAAVARHRSAEDEDPVDVLGRLTLDEWEAEFPLIDLALRETIRLTATGCGFRKNVSGRDVPIGDTGEVIPKGAYAVYLLDDRHMDPAIYSDPFQWDPSRYLPGRAEDKHREHGYVGWGAGRHPCLGMRFAKLEVAVAVAVWAVSFDYSLCDKKGQPAVMPPHYGIDRNRHSADKPRSAKIFVKYEPRRRV